MGERPVPRNGFQAILYAIARMIEDWGFVIIIFIFWFVMRIFGVM